MSTAAAEHLPVLNAYMEGEETIVLVERLPDGMRRKRRVRAEFTSYHKQAEVSADVFRTLKTSDMVASVAREEGGWMRVGWKDDFLRKRGRYYLRHEQGIESYEGDVDPIRFYMTQTRAPIAKPRVCFLDIETDSRVPFSRMEDMRILCWSVVDLETGEVARGMLPEDTDDDEEGLIVDLWNALMPFDQVLAWNGDGFDFPVLNARSKQRGVQVDPRRWLWLDMLVMWRRMNQHVAESGAEKESFRLEDIAQAQIGEGKEKTPKFVLDRFGDVPLGSIAWELWEAGGEFRKLLDDYNVRDTILLRKLEKKKGFVTLFHAICEACAVFGSTKGLLPTIQMDGFLLRLGRERHYRFATKRYADDEEVAKFKGAWVFPPRTVASRDDEEIPESDRWSEEQAREWRLARGMTTGILRDVHVCDFKSLYPSVILTWNLSEDTAIEMRGRGANALASLEAGECLSPGTGLVTRTDEHGILTIALRTLLQMRKYWADLKATFPPGTPESQDADARSNAYKVAANSFYGVTGSPTSRYFRREIAESTTQNGVKLLRLVFEEAKPRKMEAVYGDTDSAFVIGPSMEGFRNYVAWLNAKKFPAYVKAHGCAENHIELTFEKTFSRLVFTASKRYCGRFSQYKGKAATADSKPEVKGLEYKRGDTALLARKLQGQVIDLLVGGMKWKDADGVERPMNEGIETPTEDIEIYHRVLSTMRDHVLSDALPIEEVRKSQSLKGSVESYEKKKCPGCKKQIPRAVKVCPECEHTFAKNDKIDEVGDLAHVAVARIMQSRGQEVGERTRVEYVVVDGYASPMKVIPAEDYHGDCDRFYLWEKLVFPPTKRLLQAAFPEVDWESWHKVRPRASSKKSKAPKGQLGLMLDAASPRGDAVEIAAPKFSKSILNVRVPEVYSKSLDRVLETLKRHPGARPVQIVLETASGSASVFPTQLCVTTGPKLQEALAATIKLLESEVTAITVA